MNDAVNIGVLIKDFVKRRLVRDVDLVECRPCAGQQFDTVYDFVR